MKSWTCLRDPASSNPLTRPAIANMTGAALRGKFAVDEEEKVDPQRVADKPKGSTLRS